METCTNYNKLLSYLNFTNPKIWFRKKKRKTEEKEEKPKRPKRQGSAAPKDKLTVKIGQPYLLQLR